MIGWDVREGLFWIHSLRCEADPYAAARLVVAVRRKAKEMGFTKIFWQVFPETGTAMLKTLDKGRAKVDYVQMYLEI